MLASFNRFAGLSILVVALSSCVTSAETVGFSGEIFGTTFTVKARSAAKIDATDLQALVEKRLDEIDRQMSTYRDDSDVSRFGQAEPGVWFPVSAETAKLVQRSMEISHDTNGAFDITVGPALSLWNFGAGRSDDGFQPPRQDSIDNAMSRVGYGKLEVRLSPPAIKKTVDGVEIDLSAIAKGYAVDSVADTLVDIDHYMVEIGGEIRARGTKQDGAPWRIGLEAPTKNDRRVDSVIALEDTALATSGDYRNFQVHDGVSYSHTIDPATGKPVSHQLASVTILADDCATADALATAISVMGPEQGLAWAEEHAVKALLVSRSGEEFIRSSTPDFPAFLATTKNAATDAQQTSSFVGMFLVTAFVFGIAVLAMSVGAIVANRRLQGSCGGMAGLKDSGGKTICDMCTKPSPECSGEAVDTTPAG